MALISFEDSFSDPSILLSSFSVMVTSVSFSVTSLLASGVSETSSLASILASSFVSSFFSDSFSEIFTPMKSLSEFFSPAWFELASNAVFSSALSSSIVDLLSESG